MDGTVTSSEWVVNSIERDLRLKIERACSEIAPFVEGIFLAGSLAKGTAVKGSSDYDFFISIRRSYREESMSEIFNDLYGRLRNIYGKNAVRKQNVSIGLDLRICGDDYSIDVVPGKKQNDLTDDHTIWKNKKNTWAKTNVKKQIEYIKQSGCADYIRLVKIWRNHKRLELPSINLELSVLSALEDYRYAISLYDAFRLILKYFSEKFEGAKLEDVGNPSNVVSDDMTDVEKLLVANCAKECLHFIELGQLRSCF